MIKPSRQILAYVAGPYRDRRGTYYVDQNIWAARQLAAGLWARGFTAVCPHLNTSHFDGLVSDQAFLDGTLEMMRRCDLVVITSTWHTSAGTIGEIREALRLGIPVYIWPDLTYPLTADCFNFPDECVA
ncbi:DUF7768 domain-containing protein [Methylolobus aquaticus]